MCGLHAATWGGFKDSPFEGFKPVSFVRSVSLGLGTALALALATDLESTQSLIVLVGLCYALERLATEWWKSVLRDDDQSAYSIPMRLAVHGRPIDDPGRRHAIGAMIAIGMLLAWWAARAIQHAVSPLPLWSLVLVAGLGGWLTAVGGAWKDAPVEGFSGWKFLRSPVVATAWAVVLSRFTDDWVLLTMAAGGLVGDLHRDVQDLPHRRSSARQVCRQAGALPPPSGTRRMPGRSRLAIRRARTQPGHRAPSDSPPDRRRPDRRSAAGLGRGCPDGCRSWPDSSWPSRPLHDRRARVHRSGNFRTSAPGGGR